MSGVEDAELARLLGGGHNGIGSDWVEIATGKGSGCGIVVLHEAANVGGHTLLKWVLTYDTGLSLNEAMSMLERMRSRSIRH